MSKNPNPERMVPIFQEKDDYYDEKFKKTKEPFGGFESTRFPRK